METKREKTQICMCTGIAWSVFVVHSLNDLPFKADNDKVQVKTQKIQQSRSTAFWRHLKQGI